MKVSKIFKWLYTPIYHIVEKTTRPTRDIFEDEGCYYVPVDGHFSKYRYAFKMDKMYKYVYREFKIDKWGVWREGNSWYRSDIPLFIRMKSN